MFVYLVQHGIAVDEAVDTQRPLAPEGKADVERMARFAAGCAISPGAFWHSGKLRARQTAELFWTQLNALADFTAVSGLQPTDPPERIRDRIARESRDLMLVGHLPNLARVAALLLCGDPERPIVTVRNAGIICLERSADDPAVWGLRWSLSPDLLPKS